MFHEQDCILTAMYSTSPPHQPPQSGDHFIRRNSKSASRNIHIVAQTEPLNGDSLPLEITCTFNDAEAQVSATDRWEKVMT